MDLYTNELQESPELLCHMVDRSMWVDGKGAGEEEGRSKVSFYMSGQRSCGLNYGCTSAALQHVRM